MFRRLPRCPSEAAAGEIARERAKRICAVCLEALHCCNAKVHPQFVSLSSVNAAYSLETLKCCNGKSARPRPASCCVYFAYVRDIQFAVAPAPANGVSLQCDRTAHRCMATEMPCGPKKVVIRCSVVIRSEYHEGGPQNFDGNHTDGFPNAVKPGDP